MNGVNVGGWLVLERWMTPSLFADTDAEDEATFMQTPGAVKKLRHHRDTFITEEDWQWLANNGISFVRLPVGYWVLNDDAGFLNAASYLDWAFAMAEKYHIKILLNLHAVKGSQNGEMHSGAVGAVDWWRYRYETLAVVRDLAQRYRDSEALWGVQVMNEPKAWRNYFKLVWYYRRAYGELRTILKPGVYTVFHDGFVAPLFSGVLWKRKEHPVAMDSHYYLVFGKLLSKLTPKRYDTARSVLYRYLIASSRLAQPVIIGEWAAVLPQPMFNREPQEKHLAMLGDTIRRQRKTYKGAIATAYWNYKTEGRGMYNYRSLVEDGIID